MAGIYILGSKIDDLSLDEAITQIEKILQNREKGYIVTPNPEICLKAYKDKGLRRIIQKATISIPDGFGLKVVAPLWGGALKNTTTGIDLTQKIIELADHKNYSILFLGGRRETGERAQKLLKGKYPNLKIYYFNGGNFDLHGNSSEQGLISQINSLKPDIIFICLGAPKQEYFMANNLDRLETKLMLGVGGTIDFIAGTAQRAPQWLRKLGMEWLWRLFKEPWRWRRIADAVIIFPLACLRFRFGSLFLYRNNVAGFIINKDKKILIAKHTIKHEWKLPQGGAKNAKTKEELETAVLREMNQELGTDKFKILAMLKHCHKYSWPKNSTAWDHFKGQKQTLFLLEFTGQDSDIKLDLNEHTDWRWVSKAEILKAVAPVRRSIIQIGLEGFKDYL